MNPRPSPAFKARQTPWGLRQGGDGNLWLSKRLSNGTFRWVKPSATLTKALRNAPVSQRQRIVSKSKRSTLQQPAKKKSARATNQYGYSKDSYFFGNPDHIACSHEDKDAQVRCVNKKRFARCADIHCEKTQNVKQCYRKHALKLHPDKSGTHATQEKFKKLANCYETYS